MSTALLVLDATQLRRIQATHRGFLYQHLFAVGTLLLAGVSSLEVLQVERDEDIEVSLPGRRIYTQVKTRSEDLQPSDLTEALERFDEIRKSHNKRNRPSVPEFWIVTNAEPSQSLKEAIPTWPADVNFRSPNFNRGDTTALPPAWKNLAEAIEWCMKQAERVPFASLGSETLVWKLSGLVLWACAGERGKEFAASELPVLLEQLVIQLHSFPALPAKYRPHEGEPDFNSPDRKQLVIGFSGSGKTTWAAEGSLLSGDSLTYFDVGDAPTSAVAPSLVRELAATIMPGKADAIKSLMLPGASALQSLRALDLYVHKQNIKLTAVVDNVHRMDAAELIAIIRAAPSLRWVLLGQPWPAKAAIEAEFGIEAQTLHGWSLHEIAKEFSDHGCQISPSQAERIRHVTGGLPLFVQSSAKMVHDHYDGDAEKFIRAIENLTHPRTTGQEVILRQVQDKLPTEASQVASLLSIPDIALAVSDAKFFTAGALDLAEPRISAAIRELTDWGIVETLRDGRLAMHDAFRVLAQQAQATLRQDIVIKAKNLLVTKLMKGHGIAVFRLLCRLLPEIGQMDALVDVASDTSEYFHEFGMSQEFERVLLDAVHSDGLTPGDKFWALDTIIFWKVQSREDDEAEKYLKEAEALVEKFGPNERQIEALALKQLILAGHRGQIDLLKEIFERAVALSPEDKSFHRVLRYNYAACLYSLKEYDVAKSLIFPLIKEYFELLGLKPEDVTFKNQSEIFSKLKKTAFETDDLKHLADSLDLHASIMEGLNIPSPLARIHAFKFYAMANALTSAIKAGAKVVDEFLNMGDPVGARHFMESAMLQVFSEGRALDYFVPVHSQYAVVLAYCGEIDRAKTTMDELRPFLAASPEWQSDFEDQQRSIERIGAGLISLPQFGPPQSDPILRKSKRVKIGRNDLCPCGSGKKFKRCCGR